MQGLSVIKGVLANGPMIHPHSNPDESGSLPPLPPGEGWGEGLIRRRRMSDQRAVHKTERP